MGKGQVTKLNILDTALGLVRKLGFESVSIASLAKEVGMSKSGLFAHFNSKEKMHLMILDHAALNFTQFVFVPAIGQPRGLPRLRAILDNWMNWSIDEQAGGCPLVVASVEFDARPGVVKERIQFHLSALVNSLKKAISFCITEGHFKKSMDLDLVTFEIYSLVMGSHIYKKTFDADQARSLFEQTLQLVIERNLEKSPEKFTH